MIAIQIVIIIFLLVVLVIVYHDEHNRRKLGRKQVKVNRFWSGKDRRKSIRIDTELDVLYEVSSQARPKKRITMTRNISLGGINLGLNEKLFPGTVLDLQLNIPESSRPIFVQGKIVWVKEIAKRFIKPKGQRIFAAGIQFIQINPEDVATLHSYINQRVKNVQKEGPS